MGNKYIIDKTFEEWCLENKHEDILNIWDYDLNDKTPNEIGFTSNRKYYFKCNKGHNSYLISMPTLTRNLVNPMANNLCPYCNSVAQEGINSYGEDFIDKYWSDKNIFNPWLVQKNSHKKIWLKCVNDNTHPDHEVFASSVRLTAGCPYCTGKKVCKTNSLGYNFPQVLDVWSDKNDKTPYEVYKNGKKKYWWKCQNGIHKDYQRNVDGSILANFGCLECSRIEQGKLRREDLTGQKFNLLTVIECDEKRTAKGKGTYWFCDCECGTKHKSILATHLKSGKTQSCGCLWLDEEKHSTHIYDNDPQNNSKLHKARRSKEYLNWRNSVVTRDNYTCQCCGAYGGRLNAHHIINFELNKESNYDINNGITLCVRCHGIPIKDSFHNKYGTINNTPEQLEEFINWKRKQLGIDIPFSLEEYRNGNILKPLNIKEETNKVS